MARLDMIMVAENVYKFLLNYVFLVFFYNQIESHELAVQGHVLA
jgi:hypothetical protein